MPQNWFSNVISFIYGFGFVCLTGSTRISGCFKNTFNLCPHFRIWIQPSKGKTSLIILFLLDNLLRTDKIRDLNWLYWLYRLQDCTNCIACNDFIECKNWIGWRDCRNCIDWRSEKKHLLTYLLTYLLTHRVEIPF